ncbi:MAG TPA: hypothetical protein VEQ18_05095 [Candidatus Nitrosocosmicus sp.]|nr:hypothetical protein [Candidatus Nitrosocosmicus sp.]
MAGNADFGCGIYPIPPFLIAMIPNMEKLFPTLSRLARYDAFDFS